MNHQTEKILDELCSLRRALNQCATYTVYRSRRILMKSGKSMEVRHDIARHLSYPQAKTLLRECELWMRDKHPEYRCWVHGNYEIAREPVPDGHILRMADQLGISHSVFRIGKHGPGCGTRVEVNSEIFESHIG